MPVRLDDFEASLPPDERAAIAARTTEMLAEEADLRKLREMQKLSQEQVAKRLKINQAAVSKIERRADVYVSTLRGVIRALGGELVLFARLSDGRMVRINQFRGMKGKAIQLRKVGTGTRKRQGSTEASTGHGMPKV